MKNKVQNLTEKEIVLMLMQRDIKGMDALYENYGNYIFGLIYEVMKHNDLSEIVLQDTLLKVWNRIDTYSSHKGRFLTWMMNIARNTAIDMRRSKNYKQTLKLISLDNVPMERMKNLPDVKVENIDIKDVVASLDSKYKVLIDLVYFKGYTHIEVAKELSLPLGTVKSRIRKALKELRVIFNV